MRQFTLKDFIAYNNPCFSCGQLTSIKFWKINLNPDILSKLLKHYLNNNIIKIDLGITYNSQLNLYIDHKTNSFSSNDKLKTKKYLEDGHLIMIVYCDKCGTQIEGSTFKFNFNKMFIEPINPVFEEIRILHKGKHYSINSDYDKNCSYFSIRNETSFMSYYEITLPLLPIFKFKNKESSFAKVKNLHHF